MKTTIPETEPAVEREVPTVPVKEKHPFFKWFRRLFLVFLVLPLLVLLGFWGAMQVIDFNRYKPTIEKAFFDRNGQHLNIEGSVGVTAFPFVLSITQASVKNPEGFESDKELARFQAIEVELSLWDLFLHRQLVIKGLEIERPVLNLLTDQDGRNNWQGLQKLASSSVQDFRRLFGNTIRPHDVSWPAPQSAVYQADRPLKFQVAERSQKLPLFGDEWQFKTLILQDAKINWLDESSHQSYRIKDFDVMAFDVMPNQPFNLVTEFDYASGQNPTKIHIKLAQKLKVNASLTDWQLSDWQGNVVMRLPKKLKLPVVRMETSGKLLAWDQQSKQLSLRTARLSSLDSYIQLNLTGNYGTSPYLKGQLSSKDIQLTKWLRHAGIVLPDFVNQQALSKLSVNLNWEKTPKSLMIDQLDMTLDGAQLTGKLLSQLQASGAPSLRFDLALNHLDLNKYQAYKPSTGNQDPGVIEPTVNSETHKDVKQETYLPVGVPIKLLRALQAEGQLKLNDVKLWGLKLDRADITALSDKGRIDLAPLDADLYQGHLSSKLRVDVNGKTPQYHWSGKLQKLAIKPFLSDGWHYTKLSGSLNSWFDLHTEGVNSYLLRQNMQGHLETRVSDGAFVGLDVNRLLAGQASGEQDSTRFKQMRFESGIGKGQMTFEKCNLISERFSSICVGRVDLPKASIAAKLFTTYQKPPASLVALKGMEVPIRLKGKLDKIQWSVDTKGLLNSSANQKKLLQGLQQLLAQ